MNIRSQRIQPKNFPTMEVFFSRSPELKIMEWDIVAWFFRLVTNSVPIYLLL